MKDGVVLLVICLIGIGGVYVFWRGPSQVYVAPVEKPAIESKTAAKTAARTVAVASAKPKPAGAFASLPPTAALESSPITEAAEPEPAPPPPVAVVKPQPPFPEGGRIAPGVQGDMITRTYGDPALSAVTSSGRHVVETFVYAKERGRRATVIRVEDGKVASASSQTEQATASGLSAPRRWPNE